MTTRLRFFLRQVMSELRDERLSISRLKTVVVDDEMVDA